MSLVSDREKVLTKTLCEERVFCGSCLGPKAVVLVLPALCLVSLWASAEQIISPVGNMAVLKVERRPWGLRFLCLFKLTWETSS